MEKNKGATTIVVICVMAVIMTLSMGLFLSASVLMQTAAGTLASEQCRILAVSFSKELEEGAIDQIPDSGGLPLWSYVRQRIYDGSFPYYDEQEGGVHSRDNAFRDYKLEKTGAAGENSDITLTIYWTKKEGQPGSAFGIPDRLIVKTTAEVKGQSCTITDVYRIDENGGSSYDQWSITHEERK